MSAPKTEAEWAAELATTKQRQRAQLEDFAKKIDEVQKRRDAVKKEVEALQAKADEALQQERAERAAKQSAAAKEAEAKEDAIVDALSDLLSFSARKSNVRHVE